MNRARLDAESVRDAVLQITGKLDLTMGGPSVEQFVETPGHPRHARWSTTSSFDVDSPASYRRSVYRFLFRTLPDPFMDSLDCPDASQLSPARNASVTALQALAMLNDRFIVRQSEHFAERVGKLATDPAGQIEAAYRLALGRPPDRDEVRSVRRVRRQARPGQRLPADPEQQRVHVRELVGSSLPSQPTMIGTTHHDHRTLSARPARPPRVPLAGSAAAWAASRWRSCSAETACSPGTTERQGRPRRRLAPPRQGPAGSSSSS